jgi:hypothetical protein
MYYYSEEEFVKASRKHNKARTCILKFIFFFFLLAVFILWHVDA